MVGLLISLVVIGLLVLALQPAHRRSWRPGLDVSTDRDRARLSEELEYLASLDPEDSDPQDPQLPAATVDRLYPESDPAAAA
jgi:hypothetical protein